MEKTIKFKSVRNILVGITFMAIGLYALFIGAQLLSFSLDRALILEDALNSGWTPQLTSDFATVVAEEKSFVGSGILALITKIPVLGKLSIVLLGIVFTNFGYVITSENIKSIFKK